MGITCTQINCSVEAYSVESKHFGKTAMCKKHYMQAWKKLFKVRHGELNKAYTLRNPKKVAILKKKWRMKNVEYLKIYDRIKSAFRRAALQNATPIWLSLEELQQIKDMYKNCPEEYQVDHIIPLRSEKVCGLHVPWNLQYLTAEENLKKGNRFSSEWE